MHRAADMNHPAWHRNWRHEAFHQLQAKNAHLDAEFRLGHWQRFDYDLDAGTLVFSEQGIPKVIAEVQIAGSTGITAGDWLWAWANASLPPERIADARVVRAFGEEHGIDELTHESVTDDDLNALGWELTSVSVRISNALGAYRAPHEGGALYLICKRVVWAG